MFKNLSEKPIAEVQNEQVAKWKEEDLLNKCVTAREEGTPFIFYEGPPTANGKPILADVDIDRPVSIAANEIAEDLITYKREDA